MKKEFTIENRIQVLDELETTVAVKPLIPSEKALLQVEREIDPNMRELFKKLKMDENTKSEELWAFSKDGYLFINRENWTTGVDADKELTQKFSSVHKVYRDETGRVFLGTNRFCMETGPKVSIDTIRAWLQDGEVLFIEEFGFAPNTYEIAIDGLDVIDLCNELTKRPEVIFAEPELEEVLGLQSGLNDPEYPLQWHLKFPNDRSVDVKAEEAWKTSKGSGTTIAIIDSGCDVYHKDLNSSINNLAGYFIDLNGRTHFRRTLLGFPNIDHGTFCAGMAAAVGNNGIGVSGIAPEAELFPIAILMRHIARGQVSIAKAIAYAAAPDTLFPELGRMGADVISCSFGVNRGFWRMKSILRKAIDFATTHGRGGKGTPVFWSVSNSFVTIKGSSDHNEICAYKNTIAVGSCTMSNEHAKSSYGKELDFLAPGASVFSTISNDKYWYDSGTSFATPLAAGIGALLLSKNPNLKWCEVRDAMRDSCDEIGGVTYDRNGHHPNYGHGKVNANEALMKV